MTVMKCDEHIKLGKLHVLTGKCLKQCEGVKRQAVKQLYVHA